MASGDERLRDVVRQRLGDLHNVQTPASPSAPAPSQNQNPNPSNISPTRGSNLPHRHLHITLRAQQPATNNNNGEFPQQTQNLFHMRDRLFLALFFRISLIYARAFPKTLRRLLEFFLLMQSIMLLFILTYIHIVYNQTPITCLGEFKNSWPKDGILRVEITTDSSTDYDIQKSYEKEERLRQKASSESSSDDLLTMMLTADTLLLDKMVTSAGEFIQSVTSSRKEKPETTDSDSSTIEESTASSRENGLETDTGEASELSDTIDSEISVVSVSTNSTDFGEDVILDADKVDEFNKHILISDDDAISPSFVHTNEDLSSDHERAAETDDYDFETSGEEYFNKTIEEVEIIKMNKKRLEEEKILKTQVSDFEMFTNSVWMQDQTYIVEYALEYGFLRLSPETRQKLNIPVKIITLDPSKEPCFGDSFSRFLLDNFLGYDDILMSSIKNLAESEDNKGYLRNVVTGEQFRFVPIWMTRSAYIPALLIMLVFTVSISMLLRYSHHQIFVFIVDLLNNIEGVGAIHIPAAPLFTVILALVGMEAIMSEFFNDTSTAFYVILIVWIADQYDSVCSHTQITRTYWVRFFYLYHFAFYAYHYRFNGQYGGLALLVSWSFIQHSMVYFFHHYELPTILRQAQQDDDNDNGSPVHNYSTNNSGSSSSSTSSTTSTQTTTSMSNLTSEPLPSSFQSQHATMQPSQPSVIHTLRTNNDGNHHHISSTSRSLPLLNTSHNPNYQHHDQRCNINNISAGSSALYEEPQTVISSDRRQSQSDTTAPNTTSSLNSALLADPEDSTLHLTSSGSNFNIAKSSDAVGLNVNLNETLPSTSSGLRLRTSLPKGEQFPTSSTTRQQQQDNDELD